MSSARLQGRILRLCQKELKETIRDRRTIVTLLLMPLLVYPLLSMALNRFLLSGPAAGAMSNVYVVGTATDPERNSLISILEDPRSKPPEEILRAGNGELAEFNVINTNSDQFENPLPPLKAMASAQSSLLWAWLAEAATKIAKQANTGRQNTPMRIPPKLYL